MPFQSSLARSVGKLLKTYNQQDLGLRGAQNQVRGVLAASGGTEYSPGNGYKYHIFTSDSTFSVTAAGADLDYFVVAGGGGGGSQYPSMNLGGSGGGAGGVVTGTITITEPGNHSVVIGTGGAAGAGDASNVYGGNGTNSSISTLGIVAHGGGGGYNGAGVGGPGGSGGGGGYSATGGYGYNPTTPAPILAGAVPALPDPYTITQGYPGGPAEPSPGGDVPTAGGGGAGGVGEESSPDSNTIGSRGGIGVVAFNGDTGIPNSYGTPGLSVGRWFAGGGGGGGPVTQDPTGAGVNVSGNGGLGGGGNGSSGTNNSSNAAVNSGGGGGGGAYDHPIEGGTAGADGIVILRYLDGSIATVVDPFYGTGGHQTGGPAAIEPGNGYKYNTFTSNGNFVVPGSVSPGYVEVLIVAGGGGGASYQDVNNAGAGGGGGGLVHHASYHVEAGTTYPIVVGAGGAASSPSPPSYVGQPGANSTAFGMIALGGGGGGGYTYDGRPGGSGGGGIAAGIGSQAVNSQYSNFWFTPDPNFNQYGYPGGLSSSGLGDWGGGGGAGAAGSNNPADGTGIGGDGGDGRQYPQFTGNLIGVPTLNPFEGYFAGGGGGGNYPQLEPGQGGLGGGGGPNNNPQSPNDTQPIPGTSDTGGGGAGGSGADSAGSGGNGIVIIRYAAN